MQHKAMVLFLMTAGLAAMGLGKEDGCVNAVDSDSSVCAGRTADDSVSMLQTSMRVHPIHSKDSSPDGKEIPVPPSLLGDKECAPAKGYKQSTHRDKYTKKVLIATPLKNAARLVQPFAAMLARLSYPKSLLSVGFLVSDSTDNTAGVVAKAAKKFLGDFANVSIHQENFGYEDPADRHALEAQPKRRSVLAKSRNALLKHCLNPDIDKVLWLDADIVGSPTSLVQDLLDVDRPIVAPHVLDGMSNLTYDKNSWRRRTPLVGDHVSDGVSFFEAYSNQSSVEGGIRDHMDDLQKELQHQHAHGWRHAFRLDGAGTAVLLVDAKVHRDTKLLFPDVPYKHRLESEGFSLLAADHGIQACGLPMYFVRHRGSVSLRSVGSGSGSGSGSYDKSYDWEYDKSYNKSYDAGPTCVDIPDWDIGYGPCSTYAPGESNAYWCPYDWDWENDVYAQDVCGECGMCSVKGKFMMSQLRSIDSNKSSSFPSCLKIPGWDIGYGPCSTYAPGESNAYWCPYDWDWENDVYAQDVCGECGMCT